MLKKTRKTLLGLSALALLLSSSLASAAYLRVLGGVTDTSPQLTPLDGTSFAPKFSFQPGFTAGTSIDFMLDANFSLDIDTLWVTRVFTATVNSAGDTLTNTESFAEIPLLLRWHFPKVLSIGLGPYYAFFFGTVKQVQNIGGVSTEGTGSYSAAGQKTSEVGFMGSVGLDFPFTPTLAFIIDARYSFGVSNDSSAGGSLRFNDFMLLAGFRFGDTK